MRDKKIPIFQLEYPREFRDEYFKLCDQIFSEAYLTNHTMVRSFESAFSSFNKSKHVIAVNNGTSAIEVMLRALDLNGKKVLMPTHTFIASALAVINSGGIPVPIDIDLEDLGISYKQVIQEDTKTVAALMLVHLGGLITNHVEQVHSFCTSKNIHLVEDCAHAHGSTLNGIQAGKFGMAGAFSFHLTKTITMGEGGAIVTEDLNFADKCRSVRQFGMDSDNTLIHTRHGSNFKLTEMQAALGILELKRAASRIQRRNQISEIYFKRLSGVAGLRVMRHHNNSTCGYYKQIITSEKGRSRFLKAFEENNIMMTGGVYYYPLHKQPVMKEFVNNRNFPNADWFAENHFCPPCYPELSDNDIHRICDVIEKTVRD